ncbi:hypothetical protein [Niallia sp. Krafla_26]|uniref:hypothetical protein n=1 Tax=Niallia sp. Krafla_26 TaxID=3064703 RepID=UPI003D17E907
MKKKRHVWIATILSIAIVTFGGIRIFQIERNYEANQSILETCVENGGTVVIGQKYFWSLTSATCEER